MNEILQLTNHVAEVFRVSTASVLVGQLFTVRAVNPALAQRDLLDAGNEQALPVLYGVDEISGLQQSCMTTGIQPRGASSEDR